MSTKEKRTGSPRAVALGALAFGYTMFLRPQMLKWGTRLGEAQRRMPGDDIIPQSNFRMSHAIDIDAPPESLWPWLAQMGRERSGYYGLDIVMNYGIPSVTFLRQDIEPPAVGDELDGGYHIMELEPIRKLLFGGFSLRRSFGVTEDVTILYLLGRRSDGSTRLMARRRAYVYGALAPLYNLLAEVVTFFMFRQQLKALKAHATSMAYVQSSPPEAIETSPARNSGSHSAY